MSCASVLIVDDDEDTREMLMVLLEAEGHRCTAASNGPEAIALCRERRFDCLLLDATLGGMSGLSVAQRLGGDASGMRPTHVYLLTGHPRAEFTAALRDGWLDGHLLKPADLHQLTAAVLASLSAKQT